MPRGNPSPKPGITIDPDIHECILEAAVALWEKQHGHLTAEEINEARCNVRAQFRTRRTVRRPPRSAALQNGSNSSAS